MLPTINRYKIPDVQSGYELDRNSSWFSVLIPALRANLCTNPSVETNTTGYTAQPNTTIARTSSYQRRGVYSLSCTPALVTTTAAGAGYGFTAILGNVYSASIDVYDPAGRNLIVYAANAGGTHYAQKPFKSSGNWQRVNISWGNIANETVNIIVVIPGAAKTVAPFYVDGLLIEQGSPASSYFDGDKVGFVSTQTAYYWNGTPHASTSVRIANTGSGGYEVSLFSLGFRLMSIVGLGLGSFNSVSTPISTGGAQYQRSIPAVRQFTLGGAVMGKGEQELFKTREALIGALSPKRLPSDQALTLRYHRVDPCTGNETETLDIPCVYEGGLSGTINNANQEKQAIVFKQYLPMIVADGEQGADLVYRNTVTLANSGGVKIRNGTTGLWSTFGNGINSVAGVSTISRGPDGKYYIGGTFPSAGGVANTANIAAWDPITGLWSSVGNGTDGAVNTMDFDANGILYIGGDFAHAGGVAATRLAFYNGVAWAAMGTGANNAVNVVRTSASGVYVGGVFGSLGGVANTSDFGMWNGTAFVSVGVVNNAVADIQIGPDGSVYICGGFTSAGGVTGTLTIARLTGGAWFALAGGFSSGGTGSMTFTPSGNLYASNDSGGVHTVNSWNGVSWTVLPGTINGDIGKIASDTQGNIYLTGAFTQVNSISSLGLARYVKGVLQPGDINQAGIGIATSLYSNPINGDLVIGFSTSTEFSVSSSSQAIVNGGDSASYPIITFSRVGTVFSLTNYVTGERMYFNNLTLLTGEIITLNCDPLNFSLTSNIRGNMSNYILSGSSGISLAPGNNIIASYISGFVETGDASNQLSGYDGITGITSLNSDAGTLYLVVTKTAANLDVKLYKDSARTLLVAHTAAASTIASQPVISDNSSGISGFLRYGAIVATTSTIQVQLPLASIHWRPTYSSVDAAER